MLTKPKYTAAKSRSPDRSGWAISFRHPLCQDAQGKQGLKIRRGLGTSDEAEADRLVAQMNQLLADESFHSPMKRPDAEQKFAPVIVAAFYDKLENGLTDYRAMREQYLPLPTKDKGYASVLLVGTTGTGKTSLLHHLMGIELKSFAAIGPGKTTTTEIEVITGSPETDQPQTDQPETYQAVVTFYSEALIYTQVRDCVKAGCLAVWDDRKSSHDQTQPIADREVAKKLLQGSDQTFQLFYTLGQWRDQPKSRNEEKNQTVLATYVATLRALVDRAEQTLDHRFSQGGSEAADFQFAERLEQLSEFDQLVDKIVHQIKQRFEFLTVGKVHRTRTQWPEAWEFATDDRAEFLAQLKRFTSNDAKQFGQLLTPIVQGIRVAGPFQPGFTQQPQKLVLLDGQGLGHTAESATSVSVSTHITSRYPEVDAILLIDSAKHPMQAAPLSVLRSVVTQGHQQKLAIVFTHIDQMAGDNLPDFAAKREHLLDSVRNGLTSLRDALEPMTLRSIERDISQRCFFLGQLHQPWERWGKRDDENSLDHPQPPQVQQIQQLEALCKFCQCNFYQGKFYQDHPVDQAVAISPVYEPSGLVLVLQGATRQFHEHWDARLKLKPIAGVRGEHYQRIKALTQRIAGRMEIEYDTLKPVADLVTHLTEAINRFLNHPLRWENDSGLAGSQKAQDTILDKIRQNVADEITSYALQQLIEQSLPSWLQALKYRGTGSALPRAKEIQGIYQMAAPPIADVLDADSARFLQGLQQKVYQAIRRGGGRLVGYLPGSMPTVEELERAYRQADRELDLIWDSLAGDGLADEAW